MTPKTNEKELRELEVKRNKLSEEIKRLKQIEKDKKDKRKAEFKKKITRIFNSCEGEVVEDWYDTINLGYEVLENIKKEGELYFGWEQEMDDAISTSQDWLKEESGHISAHIKRLEDFKKKLKETK